VAEEDQKELAVESWFWVHTVHAATKAETSGTIAATRNVVEGRLGYGRNQDDRLAWRNEPIPGPD
jgi:hypothetical protein